MRKFSYGLALSLGMLSALTISHISETNAQEQNSITLCAGSPGRNYDAVMRKIGNELETRGVQVTIKNLNGSEDILNALDRGECAYGPAQKDIHWSIARNNKSFDANVRGVDVLYNEAMTMMCSEDSGIDELDEVTESTTVITDSIGSGSSLTWDNLINIEKEYGNSNNWINAQVSNRPLSEAPAAFALGEADCAFGVGAVPSGWATELNHDSGAWPVYVYDKDINDLVVGKGSLYPPKRIPQGSYTTKFDTYLIPAVLFRSNKVKVSQEVDTVVKRMARTAGRNYDLAK